MVFNVFGNALHTASVQDEPSENDDPEHFEKWYQEVPEGWGVCTLRVPTTMSPIIKNNCYYLLLILNNWQWYQVVPGIPNTVQGCKYAKPTLNNFAIGPAKVFRDRVGKTVPLNNLGRTTYMQLPNESVQGRCWEASVPEHFDSSCLHASPLRFPLEPNVSRDAAWKTTSLNTCRELK